MMFASIPVTFRRFAVALAVAGGLAIALSGAALAVEG